MAKNRRRNGQLLIGSLLLGLALVTGLGDYLLPLLEGEWQPWVVGGVGLLILLRR